MKANNLAIQAKNLVKRFGDFTAVDGIDFEVQRGEIFGFLGPNGSGKTTTIRMMLGLLHPSAGSVEVLGLPVNSHSDQIRRQVGYMAQRFSLYNDLTVNQNLRFHGRVYGLEPEALEKRIGEAAQMAGLKGREDQLTRNLSGGWRQRLALSAAILHNPKLIFLDEPTAGVDPVSRRAFWDLLYILAKEGTTVFVTTHYMDEAEHCQRLAFIQRGKIIANGSPDEITQTVMDGQVLEIEADDLARAIQALQDAQEAGKLPIEEAALYGSLIHVVAPQVRKLRPQIKTALKGANIKVGEMTVIEPSLEDVFIASMRKAESDRQSNSRETR